MLKSCLFAGALATASAATLEETLSGRALQTVDTGGLDVSICRYQLANPGARNFIAAHYGTLHDDETDNEVDCSSGQCGGAQEHGNGYGDNIDCHTTISAPPQSTIDLVFSQFNLENGAACGTSHDGVGCDVLTVYDGPDTSSPIIGVFSGQDLPRPIQSSANTLTIRFETDSGNYALGQTHEDPGFYVDWHFTDHIVTQGDGICPAPAVYTDAHGVIHDEAGSPDGPAYADGTDCYTTIHAPADEQVRFTFTALNLEEMGCSPPSPALPNGGCPAGGCDWVEIFDGQTPQSPSLGKFTGLQIGQDLPDMVSTGEWLRVEFHTDAGNCGVSTGQDAGFVATWDFVENGQNICEPDATVLRSAHGVLHDDDTTTASGYGPDGDGYGDNLDCGVRIRSGEGGTVNLHIVQMNLEGDGNGICNPDDPNYIGHSCDGNGGDFLKIYDGRDANAPLLAAVNGQPTDAVLTQDSYTSTGRDMYVHFETDQGNAGLSGTTATPGFYAEWTLIEDGVACEQFIETPGKGLIGHNNEALSGMTPAQCEAACCARPWCESFDFIATLAGGTCNLADVSATGHSSAITFNQYNSYYERPAGSMVHANPPLGPDGCAARLASLSTTVTNECCPEEGCTGALPPVCTEQCAANWMPFSKQCSVWLDQNEIELEPVSVNCEREQYGRYRPGNNHGRCSDGDLQQYEGEVAAACCDGGDDSGSYCTAAIATGSTGWNLLPPMSMGQPVCTSACRAFFEEVYAECHPRFADMTMPDGSSTQSAAQQFLGVCQGMTGGSGHRRSLSQRSDDFVAAMVKVPARQAMPTQPQTEGAVAATVEEMIV